jgi:hypothetical protein
MLTALTTFAGHFLLLPGEQIPNSKQSVIYKTVIYQKNCHPERSMARSLRQTQSKDLRLLFAH